MPKFDPAYRQRLVVDENVQYFILALYWFFSKPVEGKEIYIISISIEFVYLIHDIFIYLIYSDSYSFW